MIYDLTKVLKILVEREQDLKLRARRCMGLKGKHGTYNSTLNAWFKGKDSNQRCSMNPTKIRFGCGEDEDTGKGGN